MRRASARRRALRWALTVVLAAGTLAAAAGGAQAQPPALAPPTVLDGPSNAIQSLSGLSVARDGTGGLVYTKSVGGVAHVFVSQLASSFQAPQQVDTGLAAPSSQPVIAAGAGGLLVVAFVNGGNLYTVVRPSASSAYSAPAVLAGGASNPAIAITTLNKVYLAFTAPGAGGHDVRCAYYYQGAWGIESSPLDSAPGDDAGTGSGRPAVAASNDGVAIVVWGEAGHIFSRRVWGTSPSIVSEQADPPSVGGWTEVSADQPVIGTGGDSSYGALAFHEVFSNGSTEQSRVLMRRLHGSVVENLVQPDGLSTPGPEGAVQPQVAVGEYGQGFVTSARDVSHDLLAMQLKSNEIPRSVQRIDSQQNTAPPYAVPTAAGLHAALIAWQEDPNTGSPEIHARYYDGKILGSEQVLSSSSLGPTDAAAGLVADGDGAANMAVAWVQDDGGAPAIVVGQMYQPPGGFAPAARFSYVRTVTPTLSWHPSAERWGPVSYAVTLDGAQIAQTTGTAVGVPAALSQGRHSWRVTATNLGGQSRSDATATVFVDTVAPKVRVKLSRKRTLGDVVHLVVRATDAPAGSGIKEIRVKWGDGKSARYSQPAGRSHLYAKARAYTLAVVVTDRAGNKRTVTVHLRIKESAKKKASHGHQ